jgi:hypothetical protein
VSDTSSPFDLRPQSERVSDTGSPKAARHEKLKLLEWFKSEL